MIRIYLENTLTAFKNGGMRHGVKSAGRDFLFGLYHNLPVSYGRILGLQGGEDVNSAGFVDDLFSTLNAADFAVAPILYGGGTKTKVYDYLSLGLPLVSMKKASRVSMLRMAHIES